MDDTMIISAAIMAWLHSTLRRLDPSSRPRSMDDVGSTDRRRLRGDRGAVSLEQVLWFVAAGVSVAVVAAIMWGQIKTRANATISVPLAP